MQRDCLQKHYLLFWDVFYLEYRIVLISFLETFIPLLFLSFTTAQKLKLEFITSPIRYSAVSQALCGMKWCHSGHNIYVLSNIFQWLYMGCSSSLGCICAVKSDEFPNEKQVCVWNVRITPLSFSTLPCLPQPLSVFYDKGNGGGWGVKTQGASKVLDSKEQI